MRRVLIIGGPGAGKSSLAIKLARLTGLPLFHSDFHVKPGDDNDSRAAATAEFDRQFAKESWVIEGIYAYFRNRVADADTVIYLDIPLLLRLFRVCRRWLTGEEIGQKLDGRMSSKLLLLRYMLFRARDERRRITRAIQKRHHDTRIIVLRSTSQVESFVAGLNLPRLSPIALEQSQ